MATTDASIAGEPSLEDKLRFMSERRSYPGKTSPVTVRESHMSWVFLVGDRVYKLKKPVRFPYLDFSTLARREAACRAELILNRRLAPSTYLDVAPLVQQPTGLAIGGDGKVVDWLVVMRRLDESQALESRLRNHVTRRELDHIVAVLARFYRHARPVRLTPGTQLADWRHSLDYNRRALLSPRLGLPAGLIQRVDHVQRMFMLRCADRLAHRIEQRRIVDAHGDLRPEHIWLTDRVQIIDCIEFSARLRAKDPLDEVAFLDLECERLGDAPAGAYIRGAIISALHEREPEPLYSFYRCHRATIRAQLAMAHLLEPNTRTPEKWRPLALSYLQLAARDARRLECLLRGRH